MTKCCEKSLYVMLKSNCHHRNANSRPTAQCKIPMFKGKCNNTTRLSRHLHHCFIMLVGFHHFHHVRCHWRDVDVSRFVSIASLWCHRSLSYVCCCCIFVVSSDPIQLVQASLIHNGSFLFVFSPQVTENFDSYR